MEGIDGDISLVFLIHSLEVMKTGGESESLVERAGR